MDKTFAIVQLILAAVMFLLVISGVVGHIALGHITSLLGYLACLVFIALSWAFLRIAFKELRENP